MRLSFIWQPKKQSSELQFISIATAIKIKIPFVQDGRRYKKTKHCIIVMGRTRAWLLMRAMVYFEKFVKTADGANDLLPRH